MPGLPRRSRVRRGANRPGPDFFPPLSPGRLAEGEAGRSVRRGPALRSGGEGRFASVVKKEDKVEFVAWLRSELSGAASVVAADYRGLSVARLSSLRERCRESGVRFKVTKNTLTKRAVEDGPLSAVSDFLEGPTALAWHAEDPGAPARVLVEFLKDKKNEVMSLKGAVVGSKVMSGPEVREVLAKLPNREELLSTLAFVMTAAGAVRLHRLMKSSASGLHRCLAALKEQRAGGSQ